MDVYIRLEATCNVVLLVTSNSLRTGVAAAPVL
jgi:hypothetical protein